MNATISSLSTAAAPRTIAPRQLFEQIEAGRPVELIDVRTPVEYREVHVSCARNMPLDQLDVPALAARRGAGPLYVICRSGGRGKQACEKLLASGLIDVVNVEGGTQAWEQAGLPVTRGQKCISLERQVRITAGSLVLLGAALGFFVHPYFIGLSALIGGGLVFSGITDTCGMGLMLARLPWNRVAPTPGASGANPPNATAMSCCATQASTTTSQACCEQADR